ncbi:MAG: sporulation protein YqfD [Gracilibacteraceae bacterium]|jgi:similar to stage IV sporulation protein|nr:sporulation protein YqfD [Gracilibacteraceae bacterium]
MFIIRIWNYLRGYAIIIVKGLKIERFINLAVVNNIYIWDIEKLDYTTVQAKIGLENFRRLRDIVRKTDSSVSILSKRGFPFIIRNIRRRRLFYFSLFLICVFIYAMSSFVWMIEITGAKDIDNENILRCLYNEGLKEGSWKGRLDIRHIENRVLINMPELSWIGIQIKGTKAIVEVVEKSEGPPLISRTDACDIVAAKDGVITKLLVLSGDPLVKDGDSVRKGQKLVTGTILRENLEPRQIHSLAKVSARTWYEDAEEIPLQQIEFKPTGKVARQYKLKLLDKELSRKRSVNFKDFNEYIEERYLISLGDYVFPIKLVEYRFEELEPRLKTLMVDEAKDKCTERLNARIKLRIPEDAVILDRKIDYYTDKKSVKAKISVEVLEDIGVKQKIN